MSPATRTVSAAPGCCMCGVTHGAPSAPAELRRMADEFEHKAKFYSDGITAGTVTVPGGYPHPWAVRSEDYRKAAKKLRMRATRVERGTAGR